MPCSDSSSSINIKLDQQERFLSFDYAKITCGREIDGKTGLNEYFKGKTLDEIFDIPFRTVQLDLSLKEEEAEFVLYIEWDALRSAIAQYIGIDDDSIDKDRCQVTSVDYTEEGVEIAEVILPPKELPKILPCSLGDQSNLN